MADGWAQQGIPHMGELVTALVSVTGNLLAMLAYLVSLLDPSTSLVAFTIHDLYFRPVHDVVVCPEMLSYG